MNPAPPLQLAFYADDFTGATDALESLATAGLETALFLEPPSAAQLARHPGLQAVGVAGFTRALAPDGMERILRPAFTALRALNPRHFHYKVCSTFDSSPAIGSIGRAIELGREVFGEGVVPLLVAAPALGRYCVFGQLHARYGIGSAGAIHRLDRHPAISRHPVTPMIEADLRVHLGRQTGLRIGLVDILTVKRGPDAIRQSLLAQSTEGAAIVLFDALTETQLDEIGDVIDGLAQETGPLFSVGSSGIGSALAPHLLDRVPRPATRPPSPLPDPAPVLVISGSCSPVTAGQIEWALAHGFTGVALDAAAPGSPATTAAIVAALRAGCPVVAYSARGTADPAPVAASELGTALGQLARSVLTQARVSRLAFAGGDTSSYAARALGLESVSLVASLIPGAPLCRAHAPGSPADGLLVTFKGGQVGSPDFFERLKD
ncbi:MAG TPA: four-carbon acid sugar kinase family protein [Lacunisphaera sp.]|nr:four-carbon acid sugar kinase family protein [Lacunisphaera sp.]